MITNRTIEVEFWSLRRQDMQLTIYLIKKSDLKEPMVDRS